MFVTIYDGRIAFDYKDDGSVWCCLDYKQGLGRRFYPIDPTIHPGTVMAILKFRSRTHSPVQAEQMIIAVVNNPNYTLMDAIMGVDPKEKR